MNKNTIDIEEFVNAREKEINAMEKSIKTTNRVSLPFQMVPHYARRRNHSFMKRVHAFKRRTRQRFMLKTHIYFAKRFSMMKLQEKPRLSIPWIRNVKSKGLITKAHKIGYFVEESFKKITQTTNYDMFGSQIRPGCFVTTPDADFVNNEGVIYKISMHEIAEEKQDFSVFKLIQTDKTEFAKIMTVINKHKGICFKNSKKSDLFNTYLLLCKPENTMEMLLDLQKIFLRLITVHEISTVATETMTLSQYDYVHTGIFKRLDETICREIAEKYNRTPVGKRTAYDLNKLPLYTEKPVHYIKFKIPRGRAERSAKITNGTEVVGKVIRSEYKRSSGINCGIGFLYEESDGPLFVRTLGSDQKYPIEKYE